LKSTSLTWVMQQLNIFPSWNIGTSTL
jgi:hypothetical protein